MTVYDFLKEHRSELTALIRTGGAAQHVGNIDMFERFTALRGQGFKYIYCLAVVAKEYGCSTRKVERIINVMRRALPTI